MPAPRPDAALARGVRAGVLTAPAVGAAVAAHVLVDGCVDLVGALLAAGAVWPAAVALLGRPRHWAWFVAWVVGAQTLTHVLLAVTCHGAHAGGSPVAAHLLESASPGMVASHAAAALLTGLALGRADSALWCAQALLRLVRRLRLTWRLPRLPELRYVPAYRPACHLGLSDPDLLPGKRGPPAPRAA